MENSPNNSNHINDGENAIQNPNNGQNYIPNPNPNPYINNNYINNPYQNSNYNNSRSYLPSLYKSANRWSKAFIICYFLWIVFLVAGILCLIFGEQKTQTAPSYTDYYSNWEYDYSYDPSLSGLQIFGIILIVVAVILIIFKFIASIFLIVKSGNLKSVNPSDFDTAFILSIVGLFVPLVSLVSACMIVSKKAHY